MTSLEPAPFELWCLALPALVESMGRGCAYLVHAADDLRVANLVVGQVPGARASVWYVHLSPLRMLYLYGPGAWSDLLNYPTFVGSDVDARRYSSSPMFMGVVEAAWRR